MAIWEMMYGRLLAYRDQHGDCMMPAIYPPDLKLGQRVHEQRVRYRQKGLLKKALSPEQVRRLADIGCEWDGRLAIWNMRVLELRRYREQHGHCNVPQKDQLGAWCTTKRIWRRKGRLTPEQIAELDALGFDWNRRLPASKDPNVC